MSLTLRIHVVWHGCTRSDVLCTAVDVGRCRAAYGLHGHVVCIDTDNRLTVVHVRCFAVLVHHSEEFRLQRDVAVAIYLDSSVAVSAVADGAFAATFTRSEDVAAEAQLRTGAEQVVGLVGCNSKLYSTCHLLRCRAVVSQLNHGAFVAVGLQCQGRVGQAGAVRLLCYKEALAAVQDDECLHRTRLRCGQHVVGARLGQIAVVCIVAAARALVAVQLAVLRVLVAHHVHHAALLFHLARVFVLHHHCLSEVCAVSFVRRQLDVIVLRAAVVAENHRSILRCQRGTIAIGTIIAEQGFFLCVCTDCHDSHDNKSKNFLHKLIKLNNKWFLSY